MTSAASSTVTSMPCAMSGRYFAMTFALKKVSRKRSQLEADITPAFSAAGSGR